jgi:hypothetical protein
MKTREEISEGIPSHITACVEWYSRELLIEARLQTELLQEILRRVEPKQVATGVMLEDSSAGRHQ